MHGVVDRGGLVQHVCPTVRSSFACNRDTLDHNGHCDINLQEKILDLYRSVSQLGQSGIRLWRLVYRIGQSEGHGYHFRELYSSPIRTYHGSQANRTAPKKVLLVIPPCPILCLHYASRNGLLGKNSRSDFSVGVSHCWRVSRKVAIFH